MSAHRHIGQAVKDRHARDHHLFLSPSRPPPMSLLLYTDSTSTEMLYTVGWASVAKRYRITTAAQVSGGLACIRTVHGQLLSFMVELRSVVVGAPVICTEKSETTKSLISSASPSGTSAIASPLTGSAGRLTVCEPLNPASSSGSCPLLDLFDPPMNGSYHPSAPAVAYCKNDTLSMSTR